MTIDNLVTRDDDTVAIKISTQLAEYSKTEAELSRLKDICATTVYDIRTPKGMKTAVSLRAEIRTNRTGVEKVRKEAKAPILALGKLVDSEAERITNELLILEKPIDEKIKAEEKRKKDEQQAEVGRKAKVQGFFDLSSQVLIDCISKDSDFIKEKHDFYSEIVIDELIFLNLTNDANNRKASTLMMLGDMCLDAEKREIDTKELAGKTKQLEQLSVKPIDNELHLVELKGVTCNVIVRQATQETHEDTGILYSEFVSDMVEIPRAEYERLLDLTTPKPIETAPDINNKNEVILVNCKVLGWIEAGMSNGVWWSTDGDIELYEPTHWLPLPNAPMAITEKPKLDDADDALGR